MKNGLVIISVLFLLVSTAYATDVGANFTSISPRSYFNTTMRFNTTVTFAVVSGSVVSGNAANLQTGDTVCTGTTISATAAMNTIWGVGTTTIVSLYPSCSGSPGAYCPAMINAGAQTSNLAITWLPSFTYDSEATAAAGGSTQDPIHRATLGGDSVFHNEPVTYYNGTVSNPQYFSGKEGGAGIFCKGSFEVLDNNTVMNSSALPGAGYVEFNATTTGTVAHQIRTGFGGVSCFAALEKHPLDLDNMYYYLRYYSYTPPSMPSVVASSAITLNVVDSGGNCTMHTTAITVSRSASANGTAMVRTTVHNDADAIQVSSVTSSDPAFTAVPFPIAMCGILGFSSLCPASNGFNETINPGANKDLYVLVTTSATSGGTVLTFNAQTLTALCGASSRCTAIANLTNQATCGIVPPALTVLPLEIGQFNVACQDLAGATMACAGSNWTASPALRGTFLAADNTQSQIYSQATPPASGLVTYASSNNIAICNANMNVASTIPGNTTYTCAFTPPGANMTLNEVKYFELHCMLNGTIPTVPDIAAYSLINGLIGTTSNGSVDGVTYTAPGVSTNGNLRGVGNLTVRANVIGAVALAPIIVNTTGTPYNCTIQPPSLALGQQEYGIFTVTCMNNVGIVIPCIGNAWAWSGISGGFIAAETDNTHAWAYPTSAPGATGMLTYTSGQALCNSTITVVPENFSCAFTPPSATMGQNSTRYFAINAYDLRSGTPVSIQPTSVIYDLINGLGGSHTNDSVNGTQYTAPASNTSGQLQGAAALNTGMPNVGGAVCLAPITVGGGGNGVGPDGRSEWCTIFGSDTLYPGYIGWVLLWCGPNANQPCATATWSADGATIISSSPIGAYINVTAPIGTSGRITAVVGSEKSCYLPFNSEATSCADLS